MIRWTNTCRFTDLHAAMVLALLRADAIYSGYAVDCWVTSINDSTHMVGSRHYVGQAVDLRVHHLPDEAARTTVANTLRSALGPQFDVLYEAPGTPNSHIHVEYDPDPPAPPAGRQATIAPHAPTDT